MNLTPLYNEVQPAYIKKSFSLYLILPATLCPWVWLSIQQKRVSEIFLRVKGGRPEIKANNLTAIYEEFRKYDSPNVCQPYGAPQPATRIVLQ
jgi:hypothetical protein